MKLVQTFWTFCRSAVEQPHGWLHAEYNLMSWTLSCLSIRENYDNLELYTDSEGKRVLIDLLNLPYTKVHTTLDNFQCQPHHWALSKISTYSIQKEPFLHIDGDIYLPHSLPKRIMTAPLVAQNREIGTVYYRRMMDRILSYNTIHIPKYIEDGLRKESVASYNMGFFGGTDLEFIHRYCNGVFSFMEQNHMNNPEVKHSMVDCNVFFEQVIFAIMADCENLVAESVLGRPMKDEAYMVRDFCNLHQYENHDFFHILGGHKQNPYICDMLDRTLLARYPDYYMRVISLFPLRHTRLQQTLCPTTPIRGDELNLAQYEEWLDSIERQWRYIPVEEVFRLEKMSARYYAIFTNSKNMMHSPHKVKKNPYLANYQVASDWSSDAIKTLCDRLNMNLRFPCFDIAVCPTLRGRGIHEVAIGPLAQNILLVIGEDHLSFGEMFDKVRCCFSKEIRRCEVRPYELVKQEVEYLLYHGLLTSD